MKLSKATAVVLTVNDWCDRHGQQRPVTEFAFAKAVGRNWRFDLAWPDLLLAVEIDGGSWSPGGGRHTRGAGFAEDCVKLSTAAALGWRVVRATYAQADAGILLGWIAAALSVTPLTPAPKPQRLYAARKVRAK